MMAGHTAVPTTLPLCSDSPAIRGERRMPRRVRWVHNPPCTVAGVPVRFQSATMDTSDSPASTRDAASRMASASSSMMVSRSLA
jgi:hypothetical protein